MKMKADRRPSLVVLAVAVLGCASLAPDGFAVIARAERDVASPGEPAVIEASAVNMSDSRVQWGRGSSTCQLDLRVLVDGGEVEAFTRRACTADYGAHALDPGESRTETFHWDGRIHRSSTREVELLEPGVYKVYAAAGDMARSPAIRIRVDAGS